MRASVLAAGRLTTVLSLECHAARRHGAVLVNTHCRLLFFVDRFQRRGTGFQIREPLRLGQDLTRGVHKDVIISPDFLQRRNIVAQEGCAILLDHLSDILLTLVVCGFLLGLSEYK